MSFEQGVAQNIWGDCRCCMEGKWLIQFNSDIAKDSTETRIAFYANIGFFIEVVQMLEFNLRKLLCYELSVKEIESNNAFTRETVEKTCDRYETYYLKTYKDQWTLGKLKNEVSRATSIPPNVCDTLQELNDYRIQVVHKIFQNNVITGNLGDSEIVRSYVGTRLIPMTDKAVETNALIIKEITKYQVTLYGYKKQVGIAK